MRLTLMRSCSSAMTPAIFLRQVLRETNRRLINEFQFEKKILAALCSGQRILAQHGALRGKHVAANQSVTHEEIEVEGGKQSSESIVVDGRVVTSDATNDATLFLQAIEKARKL